MKKMLFNATQAEELRIAVAEGRSLCDLLLEHTSSKSQKKANIYKGRVTRIEPSLEAAFVYYGQERHGFLPIKEVAYPDNYKDSDRPQIKDLLKEGQEILIQVDKEERGNKGAALSTFISLAGSYLVLMPNNPKAGGISRRIEGEDRQAMKDALSVLDIPEDMGVIIRTAGVGRSKEELQWDLNYLTKLWENIKQASDAKENEAPFLVYQESDVILRSLRDHLRPNIDEIIIDDKNVYEKIKKHIDLFQPAFSQRVKLYQDTTPLFTRYQIESQIESVFQRHIRLPSGGSIVIDRTEALVSIDINSAQATKGGDIEETAVNTNLEAAKEIARQLRLRDLGGLIVIDFIDMSSNKNQRDVEECLSQAIIDDRARIQIGRISRFGLLEMSRQRLRSVVGEAALEICPRCHGKGSIRGVEAIAISVIRLIEENMIKENTAQIQVQVPVDVATYLLNEKRKTLLEMEKRHAVNAIIIPNNKLNTPDFDLIRVKQNEDTSDNPSYTLKDENQEKTFELPSIAGPQATAELAVVRDIMPEEPAPQNVPQSKKPKKPGLLKRLLQLLKGKKKKPARPQRSYQNKSRQPQGQRNNNRSGQTSRHPRQRRQGGNNQQNRSQNSRGRRPYDDRQQQGERRGQRSDQRENRDNTRDHNRDSNRENRSNTQQQRPAAAPEARKPAPRPPAPPAAEPVKNEKPVIPAVVHQTIVAPSQTIAPTRKASAEASKYAQVETKNGANITAPVAKAPERVKPVRPPKPVVQSAESLQMVETKEDK